MSPTILLVSFQRTIGIHVTEISNPTEFQKQTSKFRAAQVAQIYRAENGAREEEEVKEGREKKEGREGRRGKKRKV